MPEEPKQIIDPHSGDKLRAEDILGELCQVLRKHGYGLLFNPQRSCMVLAKVGAMGHEARVVAHVSRLLPEGATFAEVDWTPKPRRAN